MGPFGPETHNRTAHYLPNWASRAARRSKGKRLKMGRRDHTYGEGDNRGEDGGEDYGKWSSAGDESGASGAYFAGEKESSAEGKVGRPYAEEEERGRIMVIWKRRQGGGQKAQQQEKWSGQDRRKTVEEGGRMGGDGGTQQSCNGDSANKARSPLTAPP